MPGKINAPSDVRADVIEQFHERAGGGGMTEVLIDLESDEMLPSGQSTCSGTRLMEPPTDPGASSRRLVSSGRAVLT